MKIELNKIEWNVLSISAVNRIYRSKSCYLRKSTTVSIPFRFIAFVFLFLLTLTNFKHIKYQWNNEVDESTAFEMRKRSCNEEKKKTKKWMGNDEAVNATHNSQDDKTAIRMNRMNWQARICYSDRGNRQCWCEHCRCWSFIFIWVCCSLAE